MLWLCCGSFSPSRDYNSLLLWAAWSIQMQNHVVVVVGLGWLINSTHIQFTVFFFCGLCHIIALNLKYSHDVWLLDDTESMYVMKWLPPTHSFTYSCSSSGVLLLLCIVDTGCHEQSCSLSLSHLLSATATTIIVIKNVSRFSTPLAVSQSFGQVNSFSIEIGWNLMFPLLYMLVVAAAAGLVRN